ncbi:MAG: RidA family protein [Bdellovibrionales bacterium]|nr:RidA family protein [Bdellovibrionales bacterium]
MSFQRVFSGAPWEKKVGYCRVLKAGNNIYITGTAPIDEKGQTLKTKDAYKQARRCFEIIRDSLKKIDVPMSKIVRTRMFVTDISLWEEFGRAHEEFFIEHPPTTSMIEVKGLIDPDMLIEIEADAYVGET